MELLRSHIGQCLRAQRISQSRTLRDVAKAARVSLGYLSEVERGQKEASSEILASVTEALDVPLSQLLREVSDRVATSESVFGDNTFIPDTVPDAFVTEAEIYSH